MACTAGRRRVEWDDRNEDESDGHIYILDAGLDDRLKGIRKCV